MGARKKNNSSNVTQLSQFVVNSEALRIAAGHNLKRMLNKQFPFR